jgi:5-methylcytosine-specific restriction endonuclease McrA
VEKSPGGGGTIRRIGADALFEKLADCSYCLHPDKTTNEQKEVGAEIHPEGRKEIHKNLGINLSMLGALVRQPLYGRSAEYADNRLSLYCAQYGKCAVTGQVFEISEDIHCHHKLPRSKGGNDKYQNLILVHETVHILIHATTESTIEKYLALTNLNKKQLAKLNKLRVEVGNLPIAT